MSDYDDKLKKAKDLGISFNVPKPKKEDLEKALIEANVSVNPKNKNEDFFAKGTDFKKNPYKYKIGKNKKEDLLIEELLKKIGITGVVFDKDALAFTCFDNSRKYLHKIIDIGVIKRDFERTKNFVPIKNNRVYNTSKIQ